MKKIKLLLLLLVACMGLTAAAQMPQLPMDSAVRYGKLPNGLTYYVRHNAKPEKRVNFYIAQKVGSVQEEDAQRGLAHFLEHMCFNGTTHFPGDRIVKYCESIGVQFGTDLNAYTSTDETVYRICNVPVNQNNVDSCLLILHDWANDLTLDAKEIDKERGVIHEEWRLRSSAQQRIFERDLPKLYPGSRYAYRMPIGTMQVVDNFKPEELRAYYKKWYRPDLQGIIVVGDIDADKVVEQIKKLFSPIKMPANPAKYEHYPVPTTDSAIYVVDKDKEQQVPVILIHFKHEPLIPENVKQQMPAAVISTNYILNVALDALNARLNELSQKADCPFIQASVSDDHFLVSKTVDAFMLAVVPKDGKDKQAVQTALEEVERAAKFGITGTEAIRQRDEYMSRLERIYDNRDKQENDFFGPQYSRHFLESEPIPSIADEYNLTKTLSQQVPAAALAQAGSEIIKQLTASTDTNFVVLAMYPEKEGVAVPTADDFRSAVAAAKAAKLTAYVDKVNNDPLVPALPKKGSIKKEEKAAFGYTLWTLSNGARVYFKHTDFDESSVSFSASSLGGESKVATADLVNAKLLPAVMASTGLGKFTSTELEKKLAGKQASVNAGLGTYTDKLSGNSTPKDLRTLFELIYLRFQTPAVDTAAYNSLMVSLRTMLENAGKLPETAFSDSISPTIYGHNPRIVKLNINTIKQANYDKIRQIYADRFASAGDFDFFFTGNFNVDSLRTFTEQYIASLPGVKKRETVKDLKIYPVKGVVNNFFTRKMETPKANIFQMYSGTVPYTTKTAVTVDAFGQILSQRLLQSIREEGSMAYSVGSAAEADYGFRDDYIVQIQCPVKPAKRDSALLLMKQGIDDIAAKGVTAEELDKVKKFMLKTFDNNQKENSYWQGLIQAKVQWNKDERSDYQQAVNSLTSDDIKKFVSGTMLKQNNVATVSMLPADFKE